MTAKPSIGFIGLGIMGLPMARNLLKSGYAVCALNRSPERVAALMAEGATSAPTAAAVAAGSDVVITMLPDTPDVEAVALGHDGVAAGIRADSQRNSPSAACRRWMPRSAAAKRVRSKRRCRSWLGAMN